MNSTNIVYKYSDDASTVNRTSIPVQNMNVTFDSAFNVTEGDSYSQDEDIADWLLKITLVILLGVGTVGNVLSFLVMRRPFVKHTWMGFFMAVLSIVDTLVLVFGLSRHLVRSYSDVDIRKLHDVICKGHRFIVYSSQDLGAWVLVTLTVGRFISIRYPFKSVKLCSIRRAKMIVALLVVVICAKNMHLFWTFALQDLPKKGPSCTVLPQHKEFLNFVWPWIALTIYVAGPFTTMIIMNLLISKSLRSAKKFRDKSAITSKTYFDQNGKPNNSDSSTTRSMTIMLLVVNFVFLITTTPSFAVLIIEKFQEVPLVVDAIVTILNYTNHAVNFLLYCVSGKRFRIELRRLVRRSSYREQKEYARSRGFVSLLAPNKDTLTTGSSPGSGSRQNSINLLSAVANDGGGTTYV